MRPSPIRPLLALALCATLAVVVTAQTPTIIQVDPVFTLVGQNTTITVFGSYLTRKNSISMSLSSATNLEATPVTCTVSTDPAAPVYPPSYPPAYPGDHMADMLLEAECDTATLEAGEYLVQVIADTRPSNKAPFFVRGTAPPATTLKRTEVVMQSKMAVGCELAKKLREWGSGV